MSGTGTIDHPWDIQTAFFDLGASEIGGNRAIERNVNLLSSQYSDALFDSGVIVVALNGAEDRPITVKPVNNSTLDGDILITGSYLILKDLEICWSGWDRRQTETPGSDPADLLRKNITGYGTNVKLINCVLHDLAGPYFPESMSSLEVYGCVVYHMGWLSERGHGHGLYLHNTVPTMIIKDNIIHDNFGWGIHAYCPTGERLKYFCFEGNTSFSNGSLANDPTPSLLLGADSGKADTASFVSNMTYGGKVGLQFYRDGATNITLTDNYLPDGITGSYEGTDSGTVTEIGNRVFLRSNDYDPNRANLTIYNQAKAETIEVDVPYADGTQVRVRNAQDYFADIQTLTVVEGKIKVSMVNHTVAKPVQWTAPASTFPLFGCFVLEAE